MCGDEVSFSLSLSFLWRQYELALTYYFFPFFRRAAADR